MNSDKVHENWKIWITFYLIKITKKKTDKTRYLDTIIIPNIKTKDLR